MAHQTCDQLVLLQALNTHTPLEDECHLDELFSPRPSLRRSSGALGRLHPCGQLPGGEAHAARGERGVERHWPHPPRRHASQVVVVAQRLLAVPQPAAYMQQTRRSERRAHARPKIERRRQGSKVTAALPVRVVLHFLLGDWLGRGERGQLELQLRRRLSSEDTSGCQARKVIARFDTTALSTS